MRSVVAPYSARLKTTVCCAGGSGMDIPPDIYKHRRKAGANLSANHDSRIDPKSRLPKRSGGVKTTLAGQTGTKDFTRPGIPRRRHEQRLEFGGDDRNDSAHEWLNLTTFDEFSQLAQTRAAAF